MVLLSPEDGSIVLAILGPVNASVGSASLSVQTEYPFGDTLTLLFAAPQAVQLRVRIPSWAADATMAINGGQPFAVGDFAGQLYTVPLTGQHWAEAGGSAISILFDTAPRIRIEHFYAGAASVHRGALAYALQLGENVSVTRDYGWGAKDLTVTQPAGSSVAWNSVLVLDERAPEATLSFTRLGPVPALPFSSTEHSGLITGLVRQLGSWGFAADGSAQPPPQSPVDCSAAGAACGPVVQGIFVPFGSTHLRMTELPWAQL
jgi:hypothetical protein